MVATRRNPTETHHPEMTRLETEETGECLILHE